MHIKSDFKLFTNSIDIKLPATMHLSLSFKQFCRDYSFPLSMTMLVVLIVFGVFLVRNLERSSLVDLLPGISSGGKDYSTLISGDKAAVFSKNDNSAVVDGTEQSGTASSPGTTGSFAINSQGTGSVQDGNSGAGGQQTTPGSFSASISSFQNGSVTLQCSNPNKPNKGTCSKKYIYSGGISTQNGPGNVNYSWVSNIQSLNSGGSFSAASGSQTRSVQKEIIIACNNSGNYSLQLKINSPNQVSSRVENFNHNCNDI